MSEEEAISRRALVVCAHPDDADISSGGTIARWAQAGREIIYVVCTDGGKGTSDPHITSKKLATLRRREQQAAAAVLGVKEVVFLGHSDGSLEDTPAFRGELVRLIRLYRPQSVLTFDPYRKFMLHRDHRIVGIVTLDACYPYARDRLHYPEHLSEGLQPHKVKEAYLWGWAPENVDFFVDITDTFEVKLNALRCHRSQFGDFAELEARVRERATAVGTVADMPLAEAFYRLEFHP